MEQTTPVVDTPAPEDHSLADHERAYAPGTTPAPPADAETPVATDVAEQEPSAEPAAEPVAENRDDKGRFTKPRHRAKSQQAGPEDVPRIQELTRRLRTLEAELEQSRRAPVAEPRPVADKPKSPTFPSFEEWSKSQENATWEDYADARADWRYELRRTAERAEEARTSAERAYGEKLKSYQSKLAEVATKYPDFDEIVTPNGETIEITKAMEYAVLDVGPDAAYYLATHRDELDALFEDTDIDPSNPAFKAVVATTTRYLKTLVASAQRSDTSPARPAAAKTGSALSIVPKTAPKPPNPVRTSAIRESDALPDDASTLADHERAFAPKRRA